MTAALIADVIEGQLECALVGGPIEDARLVSMPAFDEELVLVAPAGHSPIASPRDLRTRTLLTFEAA